MSKQASEENLIKQHYTLESQTCSNLSCGSNINLLHILAGESILDLGCGRGAEAIEAAKNCGTDGFACGLDITSAMVDEAKINAAEANVNNIEFIVGTVEDLPYAKERFDAVMSNCVINHAKDKHKAFREIERVLKNGGRFIISDAVSKKPLPSSVKDSPEAWAQCFGGAVTEEEYIDAIRSAGFIHTEILNKREYIKNGYDFASITIRAYK